jgi:hypothetical protein
MHRVLVEGVRVTVQQERGGEEEKEEVVLALGQASGSRGRR